MSDCLVGNPVDDPHISSIGFCAQRKTFVLEWDVVKVRFWSIVLDFIAVIVQFWVLLYFGDFNHHYCIKRLNIVNSI